MITQATPTPFSRRERPLAQFLALLVLSILVPAVVLTAGLIWRIGILDRERANEQALQLARSVAGSLDREIDGSIETLLALATSPALLQGNLQGFYRQASDVMSFRKLHVLLKSVDGRQVLNTRVPLGVAITTVRLTPSEQLVVAERKPAVSDLVIGTVTERWVVSITVPVMRDGVVVWLLAMSIDPDHIARIITAEPHGSNWVIAVADAKGRLIARSLDHDRYVGQEIPPDVRASSVGSEGVNRTRARSGDDVVRGYTWSTTTGWMVTAFVPTGVVDAPLSQLWRYFSLATFILAGLAMPLTMVLGRQISGPIATAADSARRLGRDEPVVHRSSPLREANELSFALANASSQLRERTRALAQNEARFRSVFEQSAVGFEQVALDGRLIGINDRLCTMLGYTREECLHPAYKLRTHSDDEAEEDAQIAALLQGDKPHYEIEKRLIGKSGDPLWVRVTSAAVRDERGMAVYRTSVVEDVTERRRARETAARLASIVQASPDAMISTSVAGIIETWNPAARNLFGYGPDEVLGQPLSILTPPGHVDEFSLGMAAVARGDRLTLETVRRHKDGTIIDVALAATPIVTPGAITSISVTMEDIGNRKRREAHILLLNRELAHRVKNTLAVVQSIANQTVRSSPEPRAFRLAFQGRLQALAAANELLVKTNWGGAELCDFIDRQLAPLMPPNTAHLHKVGPPVLVPAELSVHLSLALHELGTNALKHGAWSVPGGHVEVMWDVEQGLQVKGRWLILTWTETNGPTVREPASRGFGMRLIDRGIPDAVVERHFQGTGLICRIALPLPARAPSALA